jgi:hypothetical protein
MGNGMIQKQDFKSLADLIALGADATYLVDDSYIYVTAANKNALLQTVIQNLFSDIQRFGFLDNTQTSISFDDTTYTFTLTSVGAGWYYMRSGRINYITGNKTVVLAGSPPATGRYFIYIDDNSGTLTASLTPWTLLDTKVLVAIVIWNNGLTPKYWLLDERHQSLVDRRYHYLTHNTLGTRVITGSTLADYTVLPAVPADDDNTVSISQASISDEDLLFTLTSVADGDGIANNYTTFYRTSLTTWDWVASPFPFLFTAAGYIQYDNGGTMTQGSSGNFYNWYLLYTNISGDARFVWVPGRAEFANAADAQAEDPTLFNWTGLGISEWVIAYQLTFGTSNAYASSGKCRIRYTARRINSNVSAPTVSGLNVDHATLLNLQGGQSGQYYHLNAAQHVLATQYASGSQGGLLSSADWTTFNNKGGGGGGGGMVWRNDLELAAYEVTEHNQFVYQFEQGGTQKIGTSFPVPDDYIAGVQLKLYGRIYSDQSSGNLKVKVTTTLIRNGVDQISDTTNQNVYTFTQIITTVDLEYNLVAELTDAIGEINDVAVTDDDTLLITLERDNTDTNTGTMKFMPSLAKVK